MRPPVDPWIGIIHILIALALYAAVAAFMLL